MGQTFPTFKWLCTFLRKFTVPKTLLLNNTGTPRRCNHILFSFDCIPQAFKKINMFLLHVCIYVWSRSVSGWFLCVYVCVRVMICFCMSVCFHSWSGHWAPGRRLPIDAPVSRRPQDSSIPPRGTPGRYSQPGAGQDGHWWSVQETRHTDTFI